MDGLFIDSLRQQADAKRIEYQELTAEKRRIEHEIEIVERYIESLNPLLMAEGLERINLKASSGTGFAAPGNRSESMPNRKPEYGGLPLAEAVEPLLRSHGRMHANGLVAAIYEIVTPEDIRRAKHSLVGTLAGMVKKGMIVRVGPNTYALPSEVNGQRPLTEAVLTS